MGIDLSDLVQKRPITLQEYTGRRVAIDAWNILYQFLASIRQPDGTPLQDANGNVTSHLAGTLYRTAALAEAGIRPAYVFDGEPHRLKKETLAARAARKEEAAQAEAHARAEAERAREAGDAAAEAAALEVVRTKAQQTSRLTVPMVQQAKQLMRAMGVPVIEAPGEGEAQAAWMCQQGLVHAAVSQDYDALLFGAPRLARHLAVGGRRKLPGKQVWVDALPEEISLEATLAGAGLSREQLVDAALLVGTDFHPGISGIGAKRAVQLIQREGSLEALLARLAAKPDSAASAVEKAVVAQAAALEDRAEVRRIFLEPQHIEVPAGGLDLRPADADAVRDLMCSTHGFSRERVDGALGRLAAGRGKQAQKTLF